MSVTSRKARPSLTQEILSYLGLANKTAAWGTLGTLRTFLSFSVDKDVQRLLRAIAGQEAATLANIRRIQKAPDPTPDFQVEAEEDIKSATSGTLQDLFLALAKGDRESCSEVIDYHLAEQDVQALKQADRPGTEETWVLILTQRNPEHLIRVFDQYQRRTGHAPERTVRDRFHGDAQIALLSLASVIRNTPLYFANKLHEALQETEPDNQALMRILISRSETDLLSIRAEYKKKFGKSLYSSLQDAVKGDCRLALLALCRAEDL
ncbi:annexin A9 [Pteropus vampyrus]|uniref:Annexin A9 n=1 Tax=Pteropus vampyrus TaxID=132908 RepID=A0A6P3REK8_PTEVA|nr:annexin A9 [Pteropus vampyrus]